MENDTGRRPLFTGLEEHTNLHSPTLLCTSYADYLKFIKNNSHKDSVKIPNKLDTRLDHLEIKQGLSSSEQRKRK